MAFLVIMGFIIVAALAFVAGMKYGLKLESDAFAELVKLRMALRKTGVKVETYLTGDVARVHAELVKVLALPKAFEEAIKAHIAKAVSK
jgi:hypothetical protein